MLVRGAVALSRRLGLSPLFVGMTVVAFGTSAPELVVSLVAVLEGAPAIAVGNVVGSNVANIMLILGISALIFPIACHPRFLQRDGSMVLASTLLFAALAMTGELGAGAGLVMLICLAGYLSYSYRRDRRDQQAAAEIVREVEELGALTQPTFLMVVKILGGIAGVVLGSELFVVGGVAVARQFGISEAVIGLTMFAIGTSLPELVTAAVAARHQHSDLALGNVVGSNIFNLLAVMGVVAVVHPIAIPAQILQFDLWVMVGVTFAFVGIAYFLRRISRLMGLVFLLLYILYVATLYVGGAGLSAA